MASIDGEGPRDQALRRRQNSSSDSGRHVPMWDSSDPDRAPPPLPLNPANSSLSPTRPNTSAHVAAAAQALADRVRENSGMSPYTTNAMRERSPEKSPTKNPQHRRLQSIQTGSLTSLKSSFESAKPSEWDGSRPGTPTSVKDWLSSSPSPSRVETPAALFTSDPFKDTPVRSPSKRPPLKSILSENTPPSATKLAIQNMPYRDSDTPTPGTISVNVPFMNITNSAIRAPQNLETIHIQMTNLTSIATTLQKEMTALSRRSKDNATDLVSLKEATKSRDEDIRKTLRELVMSVKSPEISVMGSAPRIELSRPSSGAPVPRGLAPSTVDGGSEHGRSTSPSPYAVEAAANIAMLEKIMREMATKGGQDTLLTTLSAIMDKARTESSTNTVKLEELLDFVKENTTTQALVKHNQRSPSIGDEPPQLELDFLGSSSGFNNGAISKQIPDLVTSQKPHSISDDLLKLLQKMKDSISQSGGLTGEVKSLVRELRGEVLGMGREIGRKIEDVDSAQMNTSARDHEAKEEISRVILEGLSELKQQMDQIIQMRRRDSTSSVKSRPAVDSAEISTIVKQALTEYDHERSKESIHQNPPLDQEVILTTIREAYENYKPEIELQQFGLERDEILQCLKEGLEDYQSSKPSDQPKNNITKEDVLDAVQEAMHNFTPPLSVSKTSEIKDEFLSAVRECFDDIKAQDRSVGSNNSNVGDALHSVEDLIESLRSDVRESAATNGQEVEHVLESMKNSMEFLRTDMEAYIDQAKQSSGNDEIVQMIRDGLENLRISVQSYVVETRPEESTHGDGASMAYFKAEFERLHELFDIQHASRDSNASSKHELLDALDEGFANLKTTISTRASEEPKDELLDTIKKELEHLRHDVVNANKLERDELLDAIHETMNTVQARIGSQPSDANSNDSIVELIKEEFDGLKATLAAPVLQYANAGDKEELLHTLVEHLNDIKSQLNADHNEAAMKSFILIKEELATFRGNFGESLVPQTQSAAQPAGNVELLEAIRDGLDGLRSFAARNEDEASNTELLEGIVDDIEALRETMISSLARTVKKSDTEDILEVVRQGHDDLKAHINVQHEESRRLNPTTTEILDSLHDGINDLRVDIAKFAEKPVDMDMTISYDILDTLKDGITTLRADLESLRSETETKRDQQVVLAETAEEKRNFAEEMLSGAVKKNDIEKLEVMLAHLQIKVEAMDQNMQSSIPMPSESGPIGAEALAAIELSLRDLQATLAAYTTRETTTPINSVTKDDIDAIEALLQNTKARIDDVVLPVLSDTVTKEQFEAVETVVRLTKDAMEGLTVRIEEEISTKDDLATIGVLLENTGTSLQDLKDQLCGSDGTQKVNKSDIDAIAESCTQIFEKIDSLPTSYLATSKAHIDSISTLLQTLQESHDGLRARYEGDIEVTAKAFDDRKGEATLILDQIADLKGFVERSKDDLKTRIDQSDQEFRVLDELLQGIGTKIDEASSAVPEVKETAKLMKQEFERAHATLENLQSEHNSRSGVVLEKIDEVQMTIIDEFAKKLDERFTELTDRHNEQQTAANEMAQNIEQTARSIAERSAQHDELLSSSQAMAEDLKLTIDTLGASLTGIAPALAEATERMSDDAKTVFGKVDELHNKLNEHGLDAKTDHQLTRDEISRSVAAVDGVHQEVIGFQPRFMEILASILTVASQHFDHSKQNAQKSSEDLGLKLDEIKSSFAALPLPRLEAPPPPPPVVVAPVPEKYDDTALRNKVDELLNQATTMSKSLPQTQKIDEIHQQVITTAAEVAAFVAFQNKLAATMHEAKVQDANQAAMELNKLLTEKDELETKVVNLREAKQSIASDIELLISERDNLTSQKMRLTAEVSSLTTALTIRREELQTMDSRADALERRIIDGVMDHSRALLLIKNSRRPPNMSLKRATSTTSHGTSTTTPPSNVVNAGVGMAVKARPATRTNAATSHSGGRRILSLNQITNNVPAGGKGMVQTVHEAPSGLRNLKRTQSSRNQPARTQLRKSTWTGHDTPAEFDKENAVHGEGSDFEDEHSTSPQSTTRNVQSSLSSRSASYTGTQVSQSRRTTSYSTTAGPSEYSYSTGSYLTNTESDRRTSVCSTIHSRPGVDHSSHTGSVIEGNEESFNEEDEEDEDDEVQEDQRRHADEEEEDAELDSEVDHTVQNLGSSMLVVHELQQQAAQQQQQHQQYQQQIEAKRGLVLRPPDGYDSGLGSDLPTAALSDTDIRGQYFPSVLGRMEEER